MRARRIASAALAVLGGIALLAGLLAFYARTQVLDENAFADRAEAALEDDGVRDVVSEQIVTAVIDSGSFDLLAARPLLESVVRTAIDTEPFERLFRSAALEANRVLFDREKKSVAFELSDAAQVVRFALQQLAPDVASEVPKGLDVALLKLKQREFARETLAVADDVRALGWILPLVAIVVLLLAVVVAPDRRLGVLRAAIASATTTGALAVAMLIAQQRILDGTYGTDETTDQEIRDAIAGILDAFLGDLLMWSAAIAIGGVVVATAAAVLDPEDVQAPLVRMRRRAAPPEGRLGRGLWGAAVAALGLVIALDPDSALRFVALAGAAVLLFVGASELLAMLGPPDMDPAERAHRRSLFRSTATGAAVVVAVAVATLVFARSSSDPEARATTAEGTCNGSAGLCDLRLDQAVFGGTHNSFSAADSPGWFIANQRSTISRQLEDGVRLLLLDPHWGVGETGRVSTDFDAEGRDRNRVAKALPPDTLAAAKRLAGSFGLGRESTASERDVWLCHTVCELGATRMTDALDELGTFLDRNSGEVLILFIEPYVPPGDIEDAFRSAGLLDELAVLEDGAPLPTLQEMVDADQRILVLTERDADPAYPWYHDGFELVQDTPLGAETVGETSCDENRGTPQSPLLMINNWADVFPPRAGANPPFLEEEFILHRVRECERERGQLVNLIAADFYEQGSLLEAVDELNADRVAAAEAGQLDGTEVRP